MIKFEAQGDVYEDVGGTSAIPENILHPRKNSSFLDEKDLGSNLEPEVESFDELHESINTTVEKEGNIVGTVQEYSAEDLKHIIDGVRSGTYDITAVTRTKGLRDKVFGLLEAEKAAVSEGLTKEETQYSQVRESLGMKPETPPHTAAIAKLDGERKTIDEMEQTMEPRELESEEALFVAKEKINNRILREALDLAKLKGLEGQTYQIPGNSIYKEVIVFNKENQKKEGEKTVRLYRGVSRLDKYSVSSLFEQVSGAMRTTSESGNTSIIKEVEQQVHELAENPTFENLKSYAEVVRSHLKSDLERNMLQDDIASIKTQILEGGDLKDILIHKQFSFTGGSSHHWLAPFVSVSMDLKFPAEYGHDVVMVLDVPVSEVEFLEKIDRGEAGIKGSIDPKYITALISKDNKTEDTGGTEKMQTELETTSRTIDSMVSLDGVTEEDLRDIEDSRNSEEYKESRKQAQEKDVENIYADRIKDLTVSFGTIPSLKETVEDLKKRGSKGSEIYEQVTTKIFDNLVDRLSKIRRDVKDLVKKRKGEYTDVGFDRGNLSATDLRDLETQTDNLEYLYESRKRKA